MSGDDIRRSAFIFIIPLMLLFGIVFLLLTLSRVDLSGIGVPSNYFSGVSSGVAIALPFFGAGMVIFILIIFARWKRR